MLVKALPLSDLLEHDGEALVLTEGNLVRLSEIGVLIMRRAEGGIELGALQRVVEEAFGAPPSGTTSEALASMLDALAGQGLITLDADPSDGVAVPPGHPGSSDD